jgi:hypothetical protein
MLGLVLAAERFVARHEANFAGNTMVLGWRDGHRAARDEAARADLLCLGDSLMKLGVLPRVLEAGLGRPAYNLAAQGATAPATFFLLKQALDAGARPRALIVEFDANVLAMAPRTIARYWPELIGPCEALDLGWNAHDPNLFGATALALLFPSVKNRDDIRGAVFPARNVESRPSRELLDAYLRNCRSNGGATAHQPMTVPREPPPIASDALRAPARWSPYPTNAAYVRRVLDLASARAIPVFWLVPPVSPARQAKREGNGLDEGYSEFVRETAARYWNVVVLDARHAGYGREVFIDPTHLDGRGASELSLAVADALATRLAGHDPDALRWIDLPDFRSRPIDVALETWDHRGLP